jgi:hypothetical protein
MSPRTEETMVLQESQLSHEVLKQLIIEGQVTGEVVAGDPDLLICLNHVDVRTVEIEMVGGTGEELFSGRNRLTWRKQ